AAEGPKLDAIQRHVSSPRRLQSRKQPQQRRLAGAVRAEKPHDAASRDGGRHVVQHGTRFFVSERNAGGGEAPTADAAHEAASSRTRSSAMHPLLVARPIARTRSGWENAGQLVTTV